MIEASRHFLNGLPRSHRHSFADALRIRPSKDQFIETGHPSTFPLAGPFTGMPPLI
jgi:hypothetical protein